MTATITAGNGAGETSPITVLSPYETRREARTIVHDLIGGGIAVSIVAPRPRTGDLRLLYPDEATAIACAALHGAETTFELIDTDAPSAGMVYVVAGPIVVTLDESTLTTWLVTIGYQEVGSVIVRGTP